jgi:two-component system response regulator FimZ (fimbrial Z protein)/two-component system response regulator EvgA
MNKKILIVDDHTIVRKGVLGLIKDNFSTFQTSEAGTAAEAIAILKNHQFDLLILDLNLPDANAEKVIHQIKSAAQETPIVVFSMFPINVMEKPMLKLGVAKYVNKGEDIVLLRNAIEAVLYGTVKVRKSFGKSIEKESPFADLSPKELSVMMAFFDGKTNKQIAEDLSLSQSTVGTYKQRVLEKTGADSITELLKIAIQFNVYSVVGKMDKAG